MASPETEREPLCATLGEQPMDVCFHPSRALVAAGLITGVVELFPFTAAAAGAVTSHAVHAESCRAVRFLTGGATLASAGADCALAVTDVASGARVARVADAHAAAINRLTVISDAVLATGDDEGHVRLWDTRTRARVATFRVHEDFVADMHHCDAKAALLTASGDGTLAVLDLRTNKVVARSDNQEDELLSVAVMKRGRKVVCGSQEGVLDIFDFKDIEDISDRFPGHPASVDALLPLDEDIVLTGSSDGLIRIISILPNKMLGVVGTHSDWPVERLACSADGLLLASASHDNTVKLWDIGYLREDSAAAGADAQEEEEEEAEEAGAAAGAAAAPAGADDSDGDSDDSEGGKPKAKKRKKEKEGKEGKASLRKKGGGKKGGSFDPNFFSGLF